MSLWISSVSVWAIGFLGTLCSAQNLAIDLTGTTAYVAVPHSNSLVPSTGITVEAWVFLTPNPPDQATIVRKNPGPESYILRRRSGKLEWVLRTTTMGSIIVSSTAPFPLGVWVHAAGTYDGSVARGYLDGVLVAQANYSGQLVNNGQELHIGSGNGAPYEYWDGMIDELRIWSVARSQSEIQSTMPVQLHSHAELVSAWRFNGNYQDSIGANHGFPVSTVPFVPSGAMVVSFLEAPSIVPIGGSMTFTISSLQSSAPYIFDVSFDGNTPGLPLPPPFTGSIPLNPPFSQPGVRSFGSWRL